VPLVGPLGAGRLLHSRESTPNTSFPHLTNTQVHILHLKQQPQKQLATFSHNYLHVLEAVIMASEKSDTQKQEGETPISTLFQLYGSEHVLTSMTAQIKSADMVRL